MGCNCNKKQDNFNQRVKVAMQPLVPPIPPPTMPPNLTERQQRIWYREQRVKARDERIKRRQLAAKLAEEKKRFKG